MAWPQRYTPGAVSVAPPSLPGGRATLVVMSVIAVAIIAIEAKFMQTRRWSQTACASASCTTVDLTGRELAHGARAARVHGLS